MDKLTKAAVVLGMLAVLLGTFIIGYGVGVNQIPRSVDGAYNIEYQNQTGKIVITTKIQYIEQDEQKLIVHGEPVYERVR